MKIAFLFFLIFSLKASAMDYPKSHNYDGERFFNKNGHYPHSFFTLLKWKWSSTPEVWPESVPNKQYPLPELAPTDKGIVTFINHATFLLRFQGLTVLTDPVYADRASPMTFAGPKRSRAPGVAFENLPTIDVVIISHNHYDHMDLVTLKMLDEKFHPLFIVPLGNTEILKNEGIQNVQELDWWMETRVKGFGFVLTPAEHWSARGLTDKNKALWGSFMIIAPEAAFKVYFAGDTGYAGHFKEIRTLLGGPPDLALLPIGAYEPRWFMKYHHMNPEEAVKAHLDLGAAQSIGMHFGTFQLTDEGIDRPVKDLEVATKKLSVKEGSFRVLDQGESYKILGTSTPPL